MLILRLLYAVFFPILIGFCLINLILNKKEDINLLERLALGFLAGIILIVIEMYLFSKINLRYSVLALSLPFIPIILWGIYITYKNQLIGQKFDLKGLSWIEKLLLVLIAIKTCFVFTSTLIKPVIAWDAWANYSWRAKIYFLEGTLYPSIIPPHGRPLINYLSQTWIFTCLGQWNDILGKVFYPIFYVSLLIIFYFAVRRIQSRLTTILSTCFLAFLPFLVYHTTIAYSDFPLSVFYLAGITLLIRWFNRPHLRYLISSLLLLAGVIMTKNEGFFYLIMTYIVFAFTIFLNKLENCREIKAVRILTVAGLFAGSAYVFHKIFLAPHEAIEFAPTLALSRIPQIFSIFMEHLFLLGNWNIVWFLLVLLIIFNFEKLKENFNLSLLALILLNLFGFAAYYFFQSERIYAWLFDRTVLNRNLLQFTPLTILLIGFLFKLKWKIPENMQATSSKLKNPKKKSLK